jgi:predicted transposase/invertase (TIGR01784 family)
MMKLLNPGKKILGVTLLLSAFSISFGADLETVPRSVNSRRTEDVQHVSTLTRSHPQVYGIATYDALFKYVLSEDRIRPSFFKAFIPDLDIVKSERLDDHMQPVQRFQLLRAFLHSEETTETVKRLSKEKTTMFVGRSSKRGREPIHEEDKEATAFLQDILGRFEEIQSAFPDSKYNGTMDFVCELSSGDFTMVEMQVIPQDYWDRRALAYVGAFYGNQLMRGEHFKHIKKVIGINILGGGKDNLAHWVETPTQFVRHYKVQEQLHKPARYMDGIEIIQYSIMNAPKANSNQEQQDWITFFKEGHDMTEKDVKKRIKTPAVLEAFKRSKIKELPAKVLKNYEAEDQEYDRYSQFTIEQVAKGEKAKAMEIAKGMLAKKMDIKLIAELTKLTEKEILGLK